MNANGPVTNRFEKKHKKFSENKYINRDEVTLKRSQSAAKAEEITEDERKVRRYQSDRPCHEVRDSLFSWTSGFDRFEGFVNWGALLLLLGGIRLFLENVLKYGIRIDPRSWAFWLYSDNKNDYFQSPLFLLLSSGHFLFAFIMEKKLSKQMVTERVGMIVQISHLVGMIFVPVVIFRFWGSAFSLFGRTSICCFYIVMFVKMWSYIQVNYWCRKDLHYDKKWERRRKHSFRRINEAEDNSGDEREKFNNEINFSYEPISYPQNLTLRDMYFFLAAPTLCYELNFPRSSRIRIRFLLRRVFEFFILFNILLGLFQQWIIPSVRNSFQPFAEMNYMKCIERILKLAIPNHLLWLIWFYTFFHSFLNTVAELLRFGDRNFYQDWWNATDIGTFWRLWNMPVHSWCVRHVFVPLRKNKFSKASAAFAVFSLSAFFHEYIVSIPLEMYKVHVFMGMLAQVPMVKLSSCIRERFGDRAGNIIVWASVIIGQPVGIMVYYHDYIIQNFDVSTFH